MDFCLSVTEFSRHLIYTYALCFNSEVERMKWMGEKLEKTRVQWVAEFCTQKELRKSYALTLDVPDTKD